MKPERVKQAAEETDRRIRELSAPQGEQQSEPTAESPANETGPDLTVVDDASSEPPAQDEPPAVRQEEPPPEADEDTDLKERARVAEARWKSADGMLRAQNQQIEQLRDLLAQVQDHNNSRAQEPAEPQKPSYTDNEVNAFGQDMVEYVHEVAKTIATQMIGPIQDELKALKGTVDKTSEVTHLTAQERFDTKLDQLSPSWRKLDADDSFIDWLKENTAMQRVFADGVKALDHATVANVFNSYEKLTGKSEEVKTAKRQTRNTDLEAQVAPEKTRQAAAPAAEARDQKIWTVSEIAGVYKNRRVGGTREKAMSAEDFAALEREIALAQTEGRVDLNS